MLAGQNAHDQDGRLAFDSAAHTYLLDGKHPCRSVTSVVAGAFPKFDPDEALGLMRGGSRWNPTHPLFAMSNEDIKRQWAETGANAREAGTRLHEHLDSILNLPRSYWGEAITESMAAGGPAELDAARAFLNTLPPGSAPFRTEWSIFSARDKMAGTVDALFLEPDGTFTLYDWKHAKALKWDNPYRTAHPPLRHLPDSKLARYTLQLNCYRHMLETQMSIPINRMLIVAIHADYDGGYHVYPVGRMEKEVEALARPPK